MERKKTQATTAKLKKVQTEIKKTKDKLNKLMAEEERIITAVSANTSG